MRCFSSELKQMKQYSFNDPSDFPYFLSLLLSTFDICHCILFVLGEFDEYFFEIGGKWGPHYPPSSTIVCEFRIKIPTNLYLESSNFKYFMQFLSTSNVLKAVKRRKLIKNLEGGRVEVEICRQIINYIAHPLRYEN